jgi:NADH-quinone oxidoreductase subunit F
MQVGAHTYGQLTSDSVPAALRDAEARIQASARQPRTELRSVSHGSDGVGEVRVGLGSCCMVKRSDDVFRALQQAIAELGTPVTLKRVGCVGMCHQTPLVEVLVPGRPPELYAHVDAAAAAQIPARHFRPRGVMPRLRRALVRVIDGLAVADDGKDAAMARLDPRDPLVADFLGRQRHIATEHFGALDPLDLDQHMLHDGFVALRRCLTESSPQAVIETIEASGLRGRGGAGFPTGRKWQRVRNADGGPKHVICNGDEGDPGAFMDRMILESFPFRTIEGLALAAFAVGASQGTFYIREEYPLAVERVREAIRLCRERGLLGERLLGSGFSFDVRVVQGAGAFVCGEETALIASLEGRRGMPALRPPYPAQHGLHGRPTLVNNVETLTLVPWILRHGAAPFAALGTARSKGTKVFALAGKVARGGLIEVPMGITLRQIVEEIGGGIAGGRRFKAVQVGGPSGGCVPESLADTPIDFEALGEVGAMMGSGGLVVMDDGDCMVDMARYFLDFTQKQSCGRCSLCRVGTRRMLEILERICAGRGRPADLDELEHLGAQVQAGSICGLGRTAPNPVLTTLRHFRDEYEEHLEGRCPAGRCRELVRYSITEACTGCTLCAQRCPADAIPFTPYERHEIDMERCTRCDTCRVVCPEDAVVVR